MTVGIYYLSGGGVQMIIDNMIFQIDNFADNKYLEFVEGECNKLDYSFDNTSTVSIERHSNAIDFSVEFMDGNHHSFCISYSYEDVEEFVGKLKEFIEENYEKFDC